ncbi:hypothetical protein CONLIGDRAFT_264658 [Coniochaeta ligniaria NRRL 30616]|uniref:DNA mismatch repair protein HSM3 N-terminal domain-containing protein n=1 Tax=Coniochaeta ligniaria NRRL 30616 TaxID=1408157 RepID=A0A1J7IX50_9PEZI|nr:hypothetical protein CONLIGDRAFT_264658 [Coniochaeta ligniaria NRRL 30616]
METVPVTGLEELDKHLDELVEDPTIDLNAKLFDHVELQLTDANIPPLIPRFLPRLTTILKQYQQDPAILASLSVKLLQPVSFTQILSLASEDSLIQALQSPAPSANILAMTVIEKASRTAADVAILSTMPVLVSEFLRRWLASRHVEVGQKGGIVLGNLLDIDCELPPPPPPSSSSDMSQAIVLRKAPGQGKLWRRIFLERNIYRLILDICSGRDPDTASDERQLTLAQGRLLRILPRLAALNFHAVSRSEFASPIPSYFTNGARAAEEENQRQRSVDSLLHFAALRMVDRRDRLMHLSLVDFFEAFVSLMRPGLTDYSAYKVETVRGLLREATAEDAELRAALLSLPDRIVPEEADELRRWIREVLPGEAVRVGGS